MKCISVLILHLELQQKKNLSMYHSKEIRGFLFYILTEGNEMWIRSLASGIVRMTLLESFVLLWCSYVPCFRSKNWQYYLRERKLSRGWLQTVKWWPNCGNTEHFDIPVCHSVLHKGINFIFSFNCCLQDCLKIFLLAVLPIHNPTQLYFNLLYCIIFMKSRYEDNEHLSFSSRGRSPKDSWAPLA